jgi:hypothetical protein
MNWLTTIVVTGICAVGGWLCWGMMRLAEEDRQARAEAEADRWARNRDRFQQLVTTIYDAQVAQDITYRAMLAENRARNIRLWEGGLKNAQAFKTWGTRKSIIRCWGGDQETETTMKERRKHHRLRWLHIDCLVLLDKALTLLGLRGLA